MKPIQISLMLAAALSLGLVGCSKNEPATSTAEEANKSALSAADAAAKTAEAAKAEAAKAIETAKAEAAKAVDVAKAEAAKVAEAAKAEAAKLSDGAKAEATRVTDAVTSTNNTQVQGLIDKAKNLIAEGKYSDAASMLQQLGGQSLTAGQTTIVAGLKEQIRKALGANATGGVGNLLKR